MLRERSREVDRSLGGHHTVDTNKDIPALWQRFGPQCMGRVPGQVANASYGVCYNFAPNTVFDYLAGVEVSSFGGVPSEFTQLTIPPQRYAAFPHADHVSEVDPVVRTTGTGILIGSSAVPFPSHS